MNNTEPINGEEPRPAPAEPAETPEPQAPRLTEPAASSRDPFWSYTDLLLFIGLTIPSMLLGVLLVKSVMAIFHLHTAATVLELLPEQIIGYLLLFGALRLIFRLEYGRPFWQSLGWTPMRLPAAQVAIAGVATALGVAMAGSVIHLPEGPNPMKDLVMQGGVSLVLLAAFGVGVAPLCEELAFRGFLQPLLVRSFGGVVGILVPAVAFGLLHYPEYGNSWRHALLLSAAGACFGAMRHFTRSTKAAVLMHAAYNGVLFLLLAIALASERNLHP